MIAEHPTSAPPIDDPSWLIEVRLRARRRMLWVRSLWVRHWYEGEDALAISHSEVELALATPDALLAEEQSFYRDDERARALGAEIDALVEQDGEPGWERLCGELGLAPAERRLLALALAAEINPAMRRVYGYLQNEVTPLDPNAALVAELWELACPPRLTVESALIRWALATPADVGSAGIGSATGWSADPLALDCVLAGDGTLAPAGSLSRVVAVSPGPELHGPELEEILRFVDRLERARSGIEIELIAPAGAGKTNLAAHVARRLGRPLVAVDATAVAAQADPVAAAARAARSARLAGALVVWQHADRLPARALDSVRSGLAPAFLTAGTPLSSSAIDGPVRRSFTLSPPTRAERLQLWSACTEFPPPEVVAEWALRPGEIERLAEVAPAGEAAVRDVCRRMLLETPHELLSAMPLPYTWEDLVVSPALAAHLREFEAQSRARGQVLDEWGLGRLTPIGRGVSALFAGPSGTGKTMAAQVLARSLGRELYRVDLAGVVNKYIGETEKHLRAVFAACERAPVMLFFDEADALFGRRMQVNDAHDRFANIEVDYLLQRMEQFDGVAVLATNRKGDIDTAFTRRLRFTIDFAPPTIDERERLWRLALVGTTDSAGAPLLGEVDWPRLARELDLTGAGIKASALAAAFLARSEGAPIATGHLLAAARRELGKQGTVVRPGRLEAA